MMKSEFDPLVEDLNLILTRNAFMSRTSKHTGQIKTLQFNPFRSELLATAGAKGEVEILQIVCSRV